MSHVNPSWPDGLDEGRVDPRNVIDHYKYWSTEAIRADLDARRTPLVLLLENYAYDFNVATTIRNANAFTVDRIFLSGRRRYDRRGAVGVQNYERIEHADTSREVIDRYRAEGYRIVVADNVGGAVPLDGYVWTPKTLLVFGQESIGVSQAALDLADDVVYIPQRGSVRSLNVGSASAVFLYSYTSQVAPV